MSEPSPTIDAPDPADGTPTAVAERSPESLARLLFGDELDRLTAPQREAARYLAAYAIHARNVATVAEINDRARQAVSDVKQDRQNRELPKRIVAAFAGGFVGTTKAVAFVLGRDATERDREAVRCVVGRLARNGSIIAVHQHRGRSGAKVYAAPSARKSRNPPRAKPRAVVLGRPAKCLEVPR